jgi:hypothetical protein
VHVWSGEVADQAGGVASKLQMLAQAGFVGYVSFDNVQDANRAAAILGDLGSHK